MASKKSISPTRQRKLQFLQASPENSVAESDIPIITCSLYDLISQSVKKSVRENSFIESYLTETLSYLINVLVWCEGRKRAQVHEF